MTAEMFHDGCSFVRFAGFGLFVLFMLVDYCCRCWEGRETYDDWVDHYAEADVVDCPFWHFSFLLRV